MDEQHLGNLRDEAPLPGGLPFDTDLVEVMRPHNPGAPESGGISYAGTWGELKNNITQGTTEFLNTIEVNNLNSLLSPGVYKTSTGPVAGLHSSFTSGGPVIVMESSAGKWQSYYGIRDSEPSQAFRLHNGTSWGSWRLVTTTQLT